MCKRWYRYQHERVVGLRTKVLFDSQHIFFINYLVKNQIMRWEMFENQGLTEIVFFPTLSCNQWEISCSVLKSWPVLEVGKQLLRSHKCVLSRVNTVVFYLNLVKLMLVGYI